MRLDDHETRRGGFLRRSPDETVRESMLTWECVQELCSIPLQESEPVDGPPGPCQAPIRRPMDLEARGDPTAPRWKPRGWEPAPYHRQAGRNRLGSARSIGECWVMFVNNQAEADSLLRPCLVFPLCWCEDVPHSGVLPRGLIDLAEQITIALKEERRVRERRWGLQPLPLSGFEHCDLSGIEMGCRSAWIPLVRRLDPGGRSDQARSGSLGHRRVEPRPGYRRCRRTRRSKLDLADELGARTLFIPTGQKAVGELWKARKGGTLEIRSFAEGDERGLAPAIQEYLAWSGARPDISSDFEVRVRYYLRQIDRNLSRRYYVDALLPELANYYRGQLPQDCHATHLITIASSSPELVALLAKTLQARRCLILFTKDHEGLMKQAREDVREIVPDCEVISGEIMRDDRMPVEMKDHVDRFMESIDPSKVLFDLTPGRKDMSLELAVSIARPGSYVFYLRHDFDPNLKKAIPGMKPPLVRRVA